MALDLTFLHAGRLPRCTAQVDKHFEGYQSLQFISSGAVELYYGESRQVVKGPAFWTCYPGPRIRFHGLGGRAWHHRYVAVRGPELAELQHQGLLLAGVQTCPPREAARCGGAMDRIIKLIQTPGPLSTQRAANLFESLLLDLAEWRRAKARTEPWLTMLLTAMRDSSQPDYAEMARKTGMALSTLRRRFREETGTALHHYALELRIARACQLVGGTDLPFKAIAEQLGYENVFFFSRQFRKFQGVPPLTYRRSRQG